MKLIRFKDSSDPKQIITAVDCGDNSALPLAGSIFSPIEPIGEPIPYQPNNLLAPLDPVAIFAIGRNYEAHAAEQGKKAPERPMLFMKNIASAIGPFDDIIIPKICQETEQTDFECELAVVIGKPAKNVTVEKALDFILGYTVANDISARWWQKTAGGGQFCRGKSFDTFCPLGPSVVTTDDITDPQTLDLSTTLNGETMQSSNTGDMNFSVAYLVSFLSEGTTLLPGTVILTGTPSGVGFTRKPPRFLQEGDILETKVEGIGCLRNKVRAE